MYAEFNYFKRKKGLKGTYKNLNTKNKNDFKKFASKRFYMDKKDVDTAMNEFDNYFDFIENTFK